MGKKRVAELFEQLTTNRRREIENAVGIYSIAQLATNKLEEQIQDFEQEPKRALPPAFPPIDIDQKELIQRYGSYNGSRQAAKGLGIKFKRTPSWQTLIDAFTYALVLRQVVDSYLEQFPKTPLRGVSFELNFPERND